jgi:hypothetical protein
VLFHPGTGAPCGRLALRPGIEEAKASALLSTQRPAREGSPDPGISLSDKSAVVNKSKARVKYERRAKTLIESFKATQISAGNPTDAPINLRS